MLRVLGGGGAYLTALGDHLCPRSVNTHPHSWYVIIGTTLNTHRHQSSDPSLGHRRLIAESRGRGQGMHRTHAVASLIPQEKVDSFANKQSNNWVARKSNGIPASTYQNLEVGSVRQASWCVNKAGKSDKDFGSGRLGRVEAGKHPCGMKQRIR